MIHTHDITRDLAIVRGFVRQLHKCIHNLSLIDFSLYSVNYSFNEGDKIASYIFVNVYLIKILI